MKISSKQLLKLFSAGIFIYSSVLFLNCAIANAAVQPNNAPSASPTKEQPGPISISKRDDSFTYRLEGRPDPFKPFISDKIEGTLDPNEILENDEQLSGMQLFEPGQLTLVALANSNDQKFAMVEDVSGKGYIIKEGTKIGRRGVVRSIVPNKVLIEEIAVTRAGKKLSSDIVMVLRKEEKKK